MQLATCPWAPAAGSRYRIAKLGAPCVREGVVPQVTPPPMDASGWDISASLGSERGGSQPNSPYQLPAAKHAKPNTITPARSRLKTMAGDALTGAPQEPSHAGKALAKGKEKAAPARGKGKATAAKSKQKGAAAKAPQRPAKRGKPKRPAVVRNTHNSRGAAAAADAQHAMKAAQRTAVEAEEKEKEASSGPGGSFGELLRKVADAPDRPEELRVATAGQQAGGPHAERPQPPAQALPAKPMAPNAAAKGRSMSEGPPPDAEADSSAGPAPAPPQPRPEAVPTAAATQARAVRMTAERRTVAEAAGDGGTAVAVTTTVAMSAVAVQEPPPGAAAPSARGPRQTRTGGAPYPNANMSKQAPSERAARLAALEEPGAAGTGEGVDAGAFLPLPDLPLWTFVGEEEEEEEDEKEEEEESEEEGEEEEAPLPPPPRGKRQRAAAQPRLPPIAEEALSTQARL